MESGGKESLAGAPEVGELNPHLVWCSSPGKEVEREDSLL